MTTAGLILAGVVALIAAWYYVGLPMLFAWFAIRWTRWQANTTTDDTLDFLDDTRDHRYTQQET